MTGMHPTDTTNTSDHLSTSASLITLPIPSPHAPTYLVAHITHFKGQSLMIWCGETNPMLADSASQIQRQTSNESQQNESSLLLEAESVTPASQQPSIKASDSIPPIGVLGKEWAVGMTNSLTDSSISTSLFRSNLDISKPMAARLSKRFKIPQLFLSLALPDQLLSMLNGPFSDPLGGKALLLLEGALGKVIKSNSEGQESGA